MNLAELAQRFIAVDSSFSHGTRDLARWVAQLANEWGLESKIVEDSIAGVAQANVLIQFKNSSATGDLALTTRLDTHEPGEYSQWIKTGANPFSASVSGDSIYGLGAADSKLDFLCKLMAFKELSQSGATHSNAVLIGTYGRESGSGAIRLLRKKQVAPKAVLIGAPTALRLANRAPGYAKIEISVSLTDQEKKYLERHNQTEAGQTQSKIFSKISSNMLGPTIYDNAIIRMIDYLKNVPSGMAIIGIDGGTSPEVAPDLVELELDLVDSIENGIGEKVVKIGDAIKHLATELMSLRDENFSPAYSTINLGMIRMYSEEVKISGVCRLIPAADRTIYEVWLDRLRKECSSVGAKFQIIDYKPPLITEEGGQFIQFLKKEAASKGLETQLAAAALCTEANVFHRMGIECAVFGPGRAVESDKNALESVGIRDLEAAVEFYKSVINNYKPNELGG